MSIQIATRRALLTGGGIAYLLRDEFTSALAAGSVNGTAAEPGPGTRTVVDTNNKLSIAGGALSMVVGGSPRDPRFSFAGLTRTTGRVVLCGGINIDDEGINIGWVDNVATARRGTVSFTGTDLRVYEGTTGIIVGAYSKHLDYQIAVVLRAAGVYYFIKGVAFTNWTLLYSSSTSAETPMYAFASAEDGSSTVTVDYIRVPDVLWLPEPLAYDTFTRANGAIGNSETSGPDSQAVTARTWNNRVGTTQIATNKASASALVGGLAIATVDTATADTIVSATLTRAGDEVGVVLRYADADNYIRAVHDGTNCKLIKRVATAETDVISAVVAIGAGAIRVIPDGTSFSLYLNNAKVGSTSTISDAGLQTGTEQGLFSTNTGNTQDAFEVFPRGDGAYSDLDAW